MFTVIGDKELLSKKVATEIEDAINTGKIQIGAKLPTEQELCQQFGVSRTSVREALRMLSAKGLLSIEKGRGIFVSEISSKNVTEPMHHYLKHRVGVSYVLELIEARMIIEPEIARVAAVKSNSDDIEKMRKDIFDMEKIENDPIEHARLDMDFHLNIARATKNQLLPLMLKPIFKLMPEIKSKILSDVPEAKKAAIIWHNKILSAIEEKDSEKAYEMMRKHLTIAKEHAGKMLIVENVEIEKVH